MSKITIKNFSCIKSAHLEIGRLNVIIGAQGSGKSVTTKLIYFFADLPKDALRHSEDGVSFNDYQKIVQKRFSLWFPPAAWGSEKFQIYYQDGNYNIRIMRRVSGKNPTDEVTINLSTEFMNGYVKSSEVFSSLSRKKLGNLEAKDQLYERDSFEISWRARLEAWKRMESELGEEVVDQQTFIPAGRAFFTSIGRLVAGIEHAGSLDPATLRFARIFASWRDQLESFRSMVDQSSVRDRRDKVMFELFDGYVQSKRDQEFIEMPDGRRIPFSSLSSGQQELLPIWYFLDNLLLMDNIGVGRSRRGSSDHSAELVYIEEPEAHLFPESQSKLLNMLVDVVLGGNKFRKLIVTTHSPYILARLNVMLKAGQISKRKKRNKDLGAIVDKSNWMLIEDVSVVSIKDGLVCSILDTDTGLVNADYLDSVSDMNSAKFEALLDLEDLI